MNVPQTKFDQKKSTVVVTGITGFLGSHIAIQLLKQGHNVRGTLRKLSRAQATEELLFANTDADSSQLTLFEADLLTDHGWDQAIEGADYVIHAASPFLTYIPKDENEVIKPAVEGTRRVLEACARHKVQRVVLTSSIAAVIYGEGRSPYNEQHWSSTDSSKVTPYYKSKTLAEQYAWDFAKQNDLDLCVINPGAILGPALESDYGTSAEIVAKLLKGEFLGLPNIGFAIADVRDVAELHVLALFHSEASGERFIAASEFMWFSEVASVLKDAHPEYSKAIPKRQLPSWLVRIVGYFDPAIKTILKDLDKQRIVSSHKAKMKLGWQPRTSREAVLASAESMIKLGIV